MPISPVATSSPSPLFAPPAWRTRALAVFALTKPRVAAMSVLPTIVAYATASPAGGAARAIATIAGTTLAAAGALSLNQWWERRTDALMDRTRARPLPQASLAPSEALAWSLLSSLGGVAILAGLVNPAAAALGAATILLYGVVYTPLKRRTPWATEIGSISGALPALLGNAAAGDWAARPGLTLAAILLFWQMPHFFAIGWRYRADYRRAGFPLRPAADPTGAQTARWSLAYALAVAIVSLAPWALGWFGPSYGIPVLLANGWFLQCAWRFATGSDRDRAARRLFLASIAYLPVLMGAQIVERFVSR